MSVSYKNWNIWDTCIALMEPRSAEERRLHLQAQHRAIVVGRSAEHCPITFEAIAETDVKQLYVTQKGQFYTREGLGSFLKSEVLKRPQVPLCPLTQEPMALETAEFLATKPYTAWTQALSRRGAVSALYPFIALPLLGCGTVSLAVQVGSALQHKVTDFAQPACLLGTGVAIAAIAVVGHRVLSPEVDRAYKAMIDALFDPETLHKAAAALQEKSDAM